MKIVIRTDSSLTIGSGHVMRSLTLAEELKQRGADVCFVCREHPGHLIGLIEGKGYPVGRLPKAEADFEAAPADVAHASWLGVSWQQDAAETIAALEAVQPQWLVIDHYAIDRRWEEVLSHHVGKIMVIDDLADRFHDCDILLDQNLYQDMHARYEKLVSVSCKKLLGPSFALLRSEFTEARKKLRQRDGVVKRVLVFFGGIDRTNETLKGIHAIRHISDRKFEVDVVVGESNPHKEHIQRVCEVNPGFNFHCQVANMARLMAQADVFVGSAGISTWERCCMGLPSVVITTAFNQVEPIDCLVNSGVIPYAAHSDKVDVKTLCFNLKKLFNSPELLMNASVKSADLVDGLGVTRSADCIYS